MLKKTDYSAAASPEELIEQQLHNFRQKRDLRNFIISIVVIFVICFITFGFLLGIGRVNGDSMKPNLHDGDLVLLWRLSRDYQQGDIVFFQKDGESKELVKRVIGTPGDTLDITLDGQVIINGRILEENYIYFETYNNTGDVVLPIELKDNEYFLMGDNRVNSRDSRTFGVVQDGEIDGQVIFIARGKLK